MARRNNREQERILVKHGTPSASELIDGLPQYRLIGPDVYSFIKFNGKVYTSKYEAGIDPGHSSGGGSGTVTVEEEDGSPSVSADTIKFPNGLVTDNGDGSASIASPTPTPYTTGTFTPEIIGLTTAGVFTYTTQTGQYTRIGNLVFYYIHITLTSVTTSANGIITIQELPYTVKTGMAYGVGGVIAHQNVSWSPNNYTWSPRAVVGTKTLRILGNDFTSVSGAGYISATHANIGFAGGDTIILSGMYLSA